MGATQLHFDGEADLDRASQRNIPVLSGIGRMFDSVTNTFIDSTNYDTLSRAYETTADLADTIAKWQCAHAANAASDCEQLSWAFTQVSLASWARRAGKPIGQLGREGLATKETGLTLSRADAETLMAAGRDEFLCNPDIRHFLEAANVKISHARSGLWCAPK